MAKLKLAAAVSLSAAIAALGGCASAPTVQEMQTADYGSPMSPSECRAIAEQAISYQLKDPSSAQFRNEAPCFKGFSNNVPLRGMSAQFGYMQNGEVNGKNGFGGYVGFRTYHVLMRNGVVVLSCITDSNGLCL